MGSYIQNTLEIVSLIMIWLCVIIGVCAVLASAQNKDSYYPYVPSYEPYPHLSYQRQPYRNQPVYRPQLPVYYQPALSYPRHGHRYTVHEPQSPVYYQPISSYPQQDYSFAVDELQMQPARSYYPTLSYDKRNPLQSSTIGGVIGGNGNIGGVIGGNGNIVGTIGGNGNIVGTIGGDGNIGGVIGRNGRSELIIDGAAGVISAGPTGVISAGPAGVINDGPTGEFSAGPTGVNIV